MLYEIGKPLVCTPDVSVSCALSELPAEQNYNGQCVQPQGSLQLPRAGGRAQKKAATTSFLIAVCFLHQDPSLYRAVRQLVFAQGL